MKKCTGTEYDKDHCQVEKMTCEGCYYYKDEISGDDLKLCFIDETKNCAYFTEKEVTEQYGDDWNDVPYEHNAEPPYEYDYNDANYYAENGEYRKIKIAKVFFELPHFYSVPCTGHTNSPFSVETINKGVVAWLWTDNFKLFAGTTLNNFIKTIQDNDGKIYLELEKGE